MIIGTTSCTRKAFPCPKPQAREQRSLGCLFKDGLLLGADTARHGGPIVADKNCEKIHYITESIRCCGAGTAADTEFTTALISSNMELHALQSGRKPRVVTAMTMLKQMLFRSESTDTSISFPSFHSTSDLDVPRPISFYPPPIRYSEQTNERIRYQGHVGAALVLGGVDSTGPHLFTIHPHGSTTSSPTCEQALNLVKAAIAAGIFNDLGSGSNVDACIITANSTEMLRNVEMPNVRVQKERDYKFRRGTTAWKKEEIRSLIVEETVTPVGRGDEMDTS
ncbi:proteasome subunit [Ephemerocybe angulata]|uniref:Proteasome subunit n=1 Tax=Ephemerocybe angulata TaxID=980116 RepID=A0A8H6LZX5_9AGAR|nr:proteasome subunit [Tulosesus angulatus]